MAKCTICAALESAFVIYPSHAAVASRVPRREICGHCAADLVDSGKAERIGSFAFVMRESAEQAGA
jgi:hypothetical protein